MGNIKLYVSRIEYVDGKIEYINKDDYNRLFYRNFASESHVVKL